MSPHVPEDVMVTPWPAPGVPSPFVDVTVSVEVDVPLPGNELGDADNVTTCGGAVCVTVAEFELLLLASVAVTVSDPGVVDEVYVVVATPEALVVANSGATVPFPEVTTNDTVSPGTGVVPCNAVAVMVEVDVPLATMLVGNAVTMKLFTTGVVALVWLMLTMLLVWPVPVSTAPTGQNPAVLLAM
jgi:hypothetical protein